MAMHSPPPEDEHGGGIIQAARNFARVCSHYFSARARLFRIEGKEAGAHTLKLLVLIAAIIVLSAFAWLFLCFGLISYLSGLFPQHGWLWASLIVSGGHVIIVIALSLALKQIAATPLFPLTTEELKKDQEWLNRQTQTKPRS